MAEILTPTAVTRARQVLVNAHIVYQIRVDFALPVQVVSRPLARIQDGWGNSRRPISASPMLQAMPWQTYVLIRYREYPSIGNLTLEILTGDTSIVDQFGNTMTPGEYQIPDAVPGQIALDCTGDNATDTVLCNYAEPITRTGTPPYILTLPNGLGTALPTGIAAETPNTVTLQYPANSAPQGQYLQVPYLDPSIRDASAGYVPAGLVGIQPPPPTPIVPLTIVGDDIAHTITLTFAEALTVAGTPTYILTPALGPPTWPMLNAVEAPAGTVTMDIDPAAVSVGGSLYIPPLDPTIRGPLGAYVAPGAYPVA